LSRIPVVRALAQQARTVLRAQQAVQTAVAIREADRPAVVLQPLGAITSPAAPGRYCGPAMAGVRECRSRAMFARRSFSVARL